MTEKTKFGNIGNVVAKKDAIKMEKKSTELRECNYNQQNGPKSETNAAVPYHGVPPIASQVNRLQYRKSCKRL